MVVPIYKHTHTGPATIQLYHLDVKHHYDVVSPVTVGLRAKVHSPLLGIFLRNYLWQL